MPPHPQLPWQPPGAPDIVPTPGGYQPRTPVPGTATGRPRFATTSSGVVSIPTEWSDEEAALYVRGWDDYIKKIDLAMQASSGFERLKLRSQLEDAQKGRENAVQLARLQAETSRYGTDVGARTAMKQLTENGRQFDLRHGLEQQQLGLSRAQTATEYMSTPDRYIQAGDYLNLSGRILAGQAGAGSYGALGSAQPKSEGDFAVLQSGGNPGRQANPAQAASVGGAGSDARQKALKALADIPASDNTGMDDNDYWVLRATQAVRSLGGLTPQQQASIKSSPQYLSMLGSGLRRLGDNPDEWWKRQQAGLPGQGAPGRA